MAVPMVRATEASLREVRQALQQINLAANTPPLHNWTATTDPTVNDDRTKGYSQGSWWYNTVSREIFLLADATPGAASWEDLGTQNILGGGSVNFAALSPYNRGIAIADETDEVIDESTSVLMTAVDGHLRVTDDKEVQFGTDADVKFRHENATGRFRVEMVNDDLFIIDSTSSFYMPHGTVAQRDGTPFEGTLRWNTDAGWKYFETYLSGAWVPLVHFETISAKVPITKMRYLSGGTYYSELDEVTGWQADSSDNLNALDDFELQFGTSIDAALQWYTTGTKDVLALGLASVTANDYEMLVIGLRSKLDGTLDVTAQTSAGEPELRLYNAAGTSYVALVQDQLGAGNLVSYVSGVLTDAGISGTAADHYAFKTVDGDSGSAVADSLTDTLTLTGGDGIVTAATDNPEVVTITADLDDTSLEINTAKVRRAALTGDVTASAGSNATTIAADAVTYAKIQNMTSSRLLGRETAGTGIVEEISVVGGLQFSSSSKQIYRALLTGDVTASAGSVVTTTAKLQTKTLTLTAPSEGDFIRMNGSDTWVNVAASQMLTDIEASIDHTAISNIGANSHATIDAHIADTSDPHGASMSVSTKVTTPQIENTVGDLKLQPDVDGDVTLFGDTDVADAAAGKSLYVHRKAVEGDNSLRLYVDSARQAIITANAALVLISDVGEFLWLLSGDDVILGLGDNAGATAVEVQDVNLNVVAAIDSDGNLTLDGTVDGVDVADHSGRHESAGADAIKLDDLAAPDDTTDLDVSITLHGLVPKAPNDATKYLDGTGAWTVPAGGGGPHAILDGSTHSDSVADAVTRGSLIYGNATPKWDELIKGTSGSFLKSGPDDISWALISEGDISDYTALTAAATIDTDALVVGNANDRSMVKTGILVDATDDVTGMNSLAFADDKKVVFGSGSDASISWQADAREYLTIGVKCGADITSGYLILMREDDIGDATRIPDAGTANPRLRIYSGFTALDAGDHVDFYHDGTDAACFWDNGNFNFDGGTVDITGGDLIVSGDIQAETTIGFDALVTVTPGATATVDWRDGNVHTLTLGNDPTAISFTDPPNPGVYHLKIIQNAGGSYVVTWNHVDKWIDGGATPVITTTASAHDWCHFIFDGSIYYGWHNPNFA